MATYTVIPDTVLEPLKPIRSVDGLALRDNPIAIAEGASGAPRIDGAISPAIRNGGIPNGELGAEKFQSGTTERDWVLARTAAASAFVVGAYAFLVIHVNSSIGGGSVSSGSTTSGSNLSSSVVTATGVETFVASDVSGTWRNMGGDCSEDEGTLWLRIS